MSEAKRERDLALAAILAAAEATEEKGVPKETFYATLLETAMSMVSATQGGPAGLARWHREEACALDARLSTERPN